MGLRDLLSADQKCFEKEFSLQKNVGLMFSTLNLQFKTKHKKIAFSNLTEVAFHQGFDFLSPLNLKYVLAALWMFIHRRPVKNRIRLSELLSISLHNFILYFIFITYMLIMKLLSTIYSQLKCLIYNVIRMRLHFYDTSNFRI